MIDAKLKKIVDGVVVSSRVRLARNVKNVPFPYRGGCESSAKLIDKTFNIMSKFGRFEMVKMSSISEAKALALKEAHIISSDLMKNKDNGCVIIGEDKTISVMVNEEDHLREQCVLNGFDLENAYHKIWTVDSELAKHIDIAFDKNLGYLTACLTNVGTGMRASCMLFLPALVESGAINEIIAAVNNVGLTVRGVYGEGSDAVGSLFQISNRVSLGITEEEIIGNVRATVIKICEAEQKARASLIDNNSIEIGDKIMRAYGILSNAVKYDCGEFMRLFSLVKLGIYTGVLNCCDFGALDKILLNSQPANIVVNSGRELNALERDMFRANYVGTQLKKIVK